MLKHNKIYLIKFRDYRTELYQFVSAPNFKKGCEMIKDKYGDDADDFKDMTIGDIVNYQKETIKPTEKV